MRIPKSRIVRAVCRAPFVFKAAAAILLIAGVFGQWQRQRPSGPITHAMLGFVARACPTAMPATPITTVDDGARVLNRWTVLELCDRLGHSVARCGSISTAMNGNAAAKGVNVLANHARHDEKTASRRRK